MRRIVLFTHGKQLREDIDTRDIVSFMGVFDVVHRGKAGVSLVFYSTPCLFAAQEAMEAAMRSLKAGDGRLPGSDNGAVGVKDCTAILHENLARRERQSLHHERRGESQPTPLSTT